MIELTSIFNTTSKLIFYVPLQKKCIKVNSKVILIHIYMSVIKFKQYRCIVITALVDLTFLLHSEIKHFIDQRFLFHVKSIKESLNMFLNINS